MIFLLTQMLVGLLCAALAGGAAGWLLCRTRLLPISNALRDTIHQQRSRVEQAQTDVSLISQDFDELKHRSRQQIEELCNENRRLPALHQNLEKSQLLVRQLMQKHEAQLRDLATERDTLRSRLATLGEREQALQKVSAELDQARRRLITIDTEQPPRGAANTDSLHDGEASAHEPTNEPHGDRASEAVGEPERAGAAPGEHVETSSWASARMPDISLDAMPLPAAVNPLLDGAIELDELDAAPEQPSSAEPEPPLFEPVDRHDDLKQIFGIGPVTEKALNRLGITSYSQLADLKSHDIESIAEALQIYPDRIERDDWVGNARRQLEDVLEEL